MTEASLRPPNHRQLEILTALSLSGRVLVEDLAAQFGVSPQTIRRDLNELSEAKALVRIHGGAMVASSSANLAYESRQHVAEGSKRLIGQVAAKLVPDNASLFINIGTTTEQVAKGLADHSGLLLITNNLHVAADLYRVKAIQVIVVGGSVRQGDGGVLGATAVAQIEQFRVDFAVIGTSAIDLDGTLLDFDIREVEMARAIIDHARRVILVADSSKFSRSAPVRIAEFADIDTFVTDRLPSEEVGEMCRRWNVEVIETGFDPDIDPV